MDKCLLPCTTAGTGWVALAVPGQLRSLRRARRRQVGCVWGWGRARGGCSHGRDWEEGLGSGSYLDPMFGESFLMREDSNVQIPPITATTTCSLGCYSTGKHLLVWFYSMYKLVLRDKTWSVHLVLKAAPCTLAVNQTIIISCIINTHPVSYSNVTSCRVCYPIVIRALLLHI